MTCRGCLLLITLLLLPLPNLAEEAIFVLPTISPDFPEAQAATPFEVDIPFAAVTRLSLRIMGSFQEVIYVDISRPYDTESRPVHLDLYCGESQSSNWIVSRRHQFPAGSGEFDITVELLDSAHDGWALFPEGRGRVGIACGPTSIPSYPGHYASAASSWGQVSDLFLLVTYDPALPVTTSSWDAIKSLFR
jgi:hypothetical protein